MGVGQGVEVYYKEENIWATQKAMAALFDCSTDNVGLHLKNIYESRELKKEATAENYLEKIIPFYAIKSGIFCTFAH